MLGICKQIANARPVTLEERIWAAKLAKANSTAATMLRQAIRAQQMPNMQQDGMDDFLNQLDIGDPERPGGIRGFESPDEIADFFRRDESDEWRRRD